MFQRKEPKEKTFDEQRFSSSYEFAEKFPNRNEKIFDCSRVIFVNAMNLKFDRMFRRLKQENNLRKRPSQLNEPMERPIQVFRLTSEDKTERKGRLK